MTQPEGSAPSSLDFESDRGASRSIWIAGVLVLALAGWMGSGFIWPAEEPEPVRTNREEPEAIPVAVRQSTAETVTRMFQAEGQAQPDRDSILRAETSGEIVEVMAGKGDEVEDGAPIARVESQSSAASVERAEEELARAQREFDNAETLLDRGVATADRVAAARADLAAARADLTAARQALDDATITAPFAGRIERLDIDIGEFVQAGAEIGRIVDNRPLTVTIQVPQQSLDRVREGQTADVAFITGETREGTVTFVGTSASSETRTFLAEIEVPNEDGAIPAGISAEVRIPTDEVIAHFVSPATVSLDADGALGVKTVDADNVVRFLPIEIERAQLDGVWVSGLPETAQVITVGQGFVREGDRVEPRPEEGAAGLPGEGAAGATPDAAEQAAVASAPDEVTE
ncbi:efflux RND transporter periplasmic adaptor subunit [Citreimonas salinaria]|uniref:Membrane fusion protein, multidrug efflux system n=1 Tax=Citreimonas salinaria TaxID=321339 RepID=A0A1H3J6B8_9RHOB|nr:efflux RND transporter periplasmic adaptor subunit [Citreimonas salinaria]SDY35476.1 membrane fusion protein, multidrug efflux system [Citreimonas salinaria]